jgi:hypothetical protein
VWPLNGPATTSPLCISHMQIELLCKTETTCAPSGENPTGVTPSVCPSNISATTSPLCASQVWMAPAREMETTRVPSGEILIDVTQSVASHTARAPICRLCIAGPFTFVRPRKFFSYFVHNGFFLGQKSSTETYMWGVLRETRLALNTVTNFHASWARALISAGALEAFEYISIYGRHAHIFTYL